MLKQELTTRLDEPLDLLTQVTEAKSLTRKLRTQAADFVEETKEAREAAATRTGEKVWRIGRLEKDEGKVSWPNVTADGSLPPSVAKRLGVDHVPEFFEVRASGRAEARAAVDAGQARHMKRTKGGKVTEVKK